LKEREPSSNRLKLGIVGCGWVATDFHLPAAQKVANVQVVALVDLDLPRIKALATRYDVPVITADYRDLFGQVDAVLIALPPALHAPVAIDCLKQGIHVLCEKPMATSVAEGQAMLDAAQASGTRLAVGMMRRFFDSHRFVRGLVRQQWLGPVTRFEIEEASHFENAPLSGFYVQPNTPGAGVLYDIGTHVLDLVLWWFGDIQVMSYRDDDRGGVEANLRLEVSSGTGADGIIRLSRLQQLRNQVRLYTPSATITVPMYDSQTIDVVLHDLNQRAQIPLTSMDTRHNQGGWHDFFARQLEHFASAVLMEAPLLVEGSEGLRVLTLIEQCLNQHQPLPLATWEEFDVRKDIHG